MNDPIVPRRRVPRHRRSALVLAAWLVLAAASPPAASAAIGEHSFLVAHSQLEDAGLPEPCGVATNSVGDVYVADYSEETVKIFGPTGQPITEFQTSANVGGPCAIAVDAAGNVYVNSPEFDVVKYVPSADPPLAGTTYVPDTTVNGTGTLVAEEATDVAVDPADQDVYVAEGERISSYSSVGAPISQTIGERLAEGGVPFRHVDVYGADGTVYASTGPVGVGQDEEQRLTFAGATGGTYKLSFKGASTGWEGSGSLNGTATVSAVATASGQLSVGTEVIGDGIASGTTIEEVNSALQTITLSQAATGSGAVDLRADLPRNASAAITLALAALPTIGKNNVSTKCTGTPPTQCTVTFKGALADTDVEQIVADGSGLIGTNPSISVATLKEGVPDPDQVYVFDPDGTTIEAQFDGSDADAGLLSEAAGPELAVDQSNGNVLVGDVATHGVVDEFDPEGNFVSQIGPTFGGSKAFSGRAENLAIARDNAATSPNAGDIYVTSTKNLFAFGPTIGGVRLTVEKGADGGTVESTPAGISCAAACALQFAEFEAGGTVVLKATGAPGSRFAGWEVGDCDEVLGAGGTECKVVLGSAAKTVKALFVREFVLTVLPAGAGSGTVASAPTGIDCGGSCEAEFEAGTSVVLTATPAAGSRFGGWGAGDCAEVLGAGGTQCKVTLSAAKVVEARFVRVFTLTVGTAGSGSGTVNSSPAGISCGPTCAAVFAEGETVTLTASPATGSHFVGWSGGPCTGSGSCVVTAAAPASVVATFDADPITTPSGETLTSTPTSVLAAGSAKLASSAPVSGGKALLRISCAGPGACTGTVKLTAKVKGKTIVLGTAPYTVAPGQSQTVKVKLSRSARRLLASGSIKATVSGGGLRGRVTLRPAGK